MKWVWVVSLPTRRDAVQCIEWFDVILCYIVDKSLPLTGTSLRRLVRVSLLGDWAARAKEFDCTIGATILVQCWQRCHTDVVLKLIEAESGLVESWDRGQRLFQPPRLEHHRYCTESAVASPAQYSTDLRHRMRRSEILILLESMSSTIPWYCCWGHNVQTGVMLSGRDTWMLGLWKEKDNTTHPYMWKPATDTNTNIEIDRYTYKDRQKNKQGQTQR